MFRERNENTPILKVGDVIKMSNHDCDTKEPKKCIFGDSTICSIISNHGNSWKITKVNIERYTTWYTILHTKTNIDEGLNSSTGLYSADMYNVEKIKDEKIEYDEFVEKVENSNLPDAKQQAKAMKDLSNGNISYAEMRGLCG